MAFKITNTGEAVKAQATQRSKTALGKKVLNQNTEYTMLFRKKNNSVAVAGMVGHNTNYDLLGMSFVRIPDKLMEVNEETGRIKDISGLNDWATLSSILFNAAKAKEISDAKEEQQKLADGTGTEIDTIALEQAIDKIKLLYDGRKKQGDEDAIAPKRQRLLSYSIDFNIFTEAVLIPLDGELKPEWDKAVCVEVQLNPVKQRQINTILANSKYHDINDPDGFLEIKFPYLGDTPQTAGKNAYLGVEHNVRKVNLEKAEDGTYIDPNVQSIAYKLNDTTNDHDLIFSRSRAVSYANTPEDVIAAIKRYLSVNKTLPLFIDLKSDAVKNAAKELINLDCVFRKNTKQYKELLQIVEDAEKEGKVAEAPEEDLTASLAKISEVTNTHEMEDLLNSDEELIKHQGEDTDEITDID